MYNFLVTQLTTPCLRQGCYSSLAVLLCTTAHEPLQRFLLCPPTSTPILKSAPRQLYLQDVYGYAC